MTRDVRPQNLPRNSERTFWDRVPTGPGCWEWQGVRLPKGYGQFRFLGRMWRAHRLAWLFSHGSLPNGLCVLHSCDNPPCVRPSHLFLGTNAENVADRERKHRRIAPHGGDHPRAKLTIDDVRSIRASRSSSRVLGPMYGVSPSTITHIRTGRTWRDD